MAVKQDCPVCGRKGNEGHVYKSKDDDTVAVLGAVAGGVLGFLVGGPVGAVAGAAGGHKGINFLNKKDQTDSEGYVWYRFNCMNPNCKHTWISKVKE